MLNALIRFFDAHRALSLALVMAIWVATICAVVISKTNASRDSPTDLEWGETLFLDAEAFAELNVETVEVNLDSRTNAVVVPSVAILKQGDEHFVFVKDFQLPHAFIRVPVRIATEHKNGIEIAEGLFPGDEVVVSDMEVLTSDHAQFVSNEVLMRTLDAHSCHRTEHPSFLSRLSKLGRQLLGDPTRKIHFHKTL